MDVAGKTREHFKTGGFQGGGGTDVSDCDICSNSDFYQDAQALVGTKTNDGFTRGFMLNLCNECAGVVESEQSAFKKEFNKNFKIKPPNKTLWKRIMEWLNS